LPGAIGVALNGTKPPFVVDEVVQGGPADQAGVHSGDTIVDVDGCDVGNWDGLQLTSHVRGQAGTLVDLVLDRPSSGDYEVDITRAPVTFPAVTSRMLPEGVGYIHLHEFTSATATLSGGKPLGQALTDLLASFQAQGAKGWVLDLRNDPGGEVPGLQAVGGLILPPGVIFSATDRNGRSVSFRTIGNRVPDLPLLAVLVNQQTGSAAELLSAAVQDYGIAPIIGMKTAGVANAGSPFSIGDNAGLLVTIEQTYTPHGRPINGDGVTPNIQAERSADDLTNGVDPPLNDAIALVPAGQ
jgi:carboxyl-terminal processing protease